MHHNWNLKQAKQNICSLNLYSSMQLKHKATYMTVANEVFRLCDLTNAKRLKAHSEYPYQPVPLPCFSNVVSSLRNGSKSALCSNMYLTTSCLCRKWLRTWPSNWSPRARNKQLLKYNKGRKIYLIFFKHVLWYRIF